MEEENFDDQEMAQSMESQMQQARKKAATKAVSAKETPIASKTSKLLQIGWTSAIPSLGLSLFIVWIWYMVRWWGDIFKKVLVRPGGEWIPAGTMNPKSKKKIEKKLAIVEDMASGCCCFGCFILFIITIAGVYILLNARRFGLEIMWDEVKGWVTGN